MRKNQIKILCSFCKKDIYRCPSLIRLNNNYCNRTCQHEHMKILMKGENNNNYNNRWSNEQKIKMGNTRKKLIAEGKIIPWQKGLTKQTDERLMKVSERVKELHKIKENYGMNGKSHSEETKKLMSINHRTKRGYIPGALGKHWTNTEEFKRKLSERKIASGSFKLEKNPSWKGGISFEPYTVEFNKILKKKIKNRDNKCMLCNTNIEILKELHRIIMIHHVDYDKKNNLPQNLIVLCNKCHSTTNFNREQWISFFHSLLNKEYGYEYKDGKIVLEIQSELNNYK